MTRSPETNLAFAIARHLGRIDAIATVQTLSSEPWSSDHFAGDRLIVDVTFRGGDREAAASLIAVELVDISIDGPDLFADLSLVERRSGTDDTILQIQLLTIYDCQQRPSFTDEHGNPSERCGPDLSKARPIGEVIADLKGLKTSDDGRYSAAFYGACRDSGIDIQTSWERDGEHVVRFGCPVDTQVDLRSPRLAALSAHMNARPQRRAAVIYLIEDVLGRFTDNRPYATADEAVQAALAIGGSVLIAPDGNVEPKYHFKADTLREDGHDGYPLRRMFQRFYATLRQGGRHDEIAALIRERGKRYQSGWYELSPESGVAELEQAA